VIGALEDAEDYRAFEATIIADYDAQSAVERELVLRLASLLWRLRRASTMETGLFDVQADQLYGFRHARRPDPTSQEVVHALFERAVAVSSDRNQASVTVSGTTSGFESAATRTVDLARCFLRLSNFPNYALDRLSRYEATLWRQVAQTLIALGDLVRACTHKSGLMSALHPKATGQRTLRKVGLVPNSRIGSV